MKRSEFIWLENSLGYWLYTEYRCDLYQEYVFVRNMCFCLNSEP